MADCIECGPVADQLGYRCNHCGREVCWDHRRPGDHDCRSAGTPPTRGSTSGHQESRVGGAAERDAVATESATTAGERPAASPVEDPTPGIDVDDPTTGIEDPAVEGFEADERAYPWWVYVLVVLLFVFPSATAGLLMLL